MSLKDILKSAKGGDILIPALTQGVMAQAAAEQQGRAAHEKWVIADAKMTIDCFQERADKYAEESNEYEGYFHPSSIGACLRMKWFKNRNVTPDEGLDDDGLRRHLIFETGTYLHVMFQNLCEQVGILKAREVMIVNHDLKIVGHADGILEILGILYMLEFKTINAYGFASLQCPMQGHIDQAMTYLGTLRETYPTMDSALIVYYEKNTQQLKEFIVKFDQKYYDRVILGRIGAYFDNETKTKAPDKEGPMPSAYPCRFCAFAKTCFNDSKVGLLERKLRNDKKKKKPINKNAAGRSTPAKVRKTKVRRLPKLSKRPNGAAIRRGK